MNEPIRPVDFRQNERVQRVTEIVTRIWRRHLAELQKEDRAA